VGKVKRNKQFGREHIDILTKEKHSKALVVVEVKRKGEDLISAVSQGLSYVEWLWKNKEQIKLRIVQLGWDVDIENLKLIIIAPDMDFNNTFIDASIMEHAKKLICGVILASINSDWINGKIICMTKNL